MSATGDTSYDGLAEAKRLLRSVRVGSLGTLQPDGTPFVSLVTVATAIEGHPLMLLSALSAHTQHLATEPRVSLLLAQGGKGDPLAHPRLTLTGRAERIEEATARDMARARFLARQPKAALYADFPDFSFWRITPGAAHLNGGFARAARFGGAELLVEPQSFGAFERDAVAHLNDHHGEAVALYGQHLAGAGAGAWVASGLDPEGIDLTCGDRTARVLFHERIDDAGALRAALVTLAKRARDTAAAVEAPTT